MVADIVIGANHGALYNVLHDACGIAGLDVKVMASFGLGHSWMKKPDISDFALRGIIQIPNDQKAKDVGVALCPGVTITRIGLDIFGVGTTTLGMAPKRSMKYGFGIYGELHVELPGSVTPSVFDFRITEFGGLARLHASIKGNVWENAFGTGINVRKTGLPSNIILINYMSSSKVSRCRQRSQQISRSNRWHSHFPQKYKPIRGRRGSRDIIPPRKITRSLRSSRIWASTVS